jgi:hypothetical protein
LGGTENGDLPGRVVESELGEREALWRGVLGVAVVVVEPRAVREDTVGADVGVAWVRAAGR